MFNERMKLVVDFANICSVLGYQATIATAGSSASRCPSLNQWPAHRILRGIWLLYLVYVGQLFFRWETRGEVLSFFRCLQANRHVGSADNSLHLFGDTGRDFGAIDIRLGAAERDHVIDNAKRFADHFREFTGWPYGVGIIAYSWGLHLDLRRTGDYFQGVRNG